jgi:IS66 C-terminal element/Transposase IS66 family
MTSTSAEGTSSSVLGAFLNPLVGRHRLAHASADVASTGRGITARPIDSCCGLGGHCRRRCGSVAGMSRRSDSLPTTLAAARAAIAAQRERLTAAEKRAEGAEARAAAAENEAKSHARLIEKLKFTIAKLRHMQFGQSAERGAILEQLDCWSGLVRFLDDGRPCMTNNAAERTLRCVAVGRHNNWTFAGSDEGGRRAAAIYTLVETCKLNGVDPRAWLADVLARLPDHPARRIAELLPWNWKRERISEAA